MDTWNPPLIGRISRNFRVIVFDNRGTGFSGASDEPFSVPLFAKDAAGLMERLGIARAHVLGFSMGACIAQELALMSPGKSRPADPCCRGLRGSGSGAGIAGYFCPAHRQEAVPSKT